MPRLKFTGSTGCDRVLRSLVLAVLFATSGAANAGDILRGGVPLSGSRRTAHAGSGSGAADAAKTQTNAKDRLSRTSAALDAVKAMQAAARNAAQAGSPRRQSNPISAGKLPRVSDGLGKNGLQVDPRVPGNLKKPKAGEDASLWTGAKLPTQTAGKDGRKNVTIVQTDQQAVLNWRTFNVGKKTSLYFDQTAGGSDRGKWVAFNKINDPKEKPSQILGSIRADGQVYVINQNGIIFGGASQVNVHTLVASALPINDNLIVSGLVNNPDAQFLFSALPLPTGSKGAPAFVPPAVTNASGRLGDVVVEAGAEITSPTTAAKVGGRVMLVGANVTNGGTISTPDGQTVLAAGLQVGMLPHSSADTSLRGVDVFVGAVFDPASKDPAYAGRVVNRGLIDAPRASVTMTGRDVRQNGFIDSTTTVSLNGRVDLLANFDAVTNTAYDPVKSPNVPAFVYQSTGTVTLGKNSVVRILPDLASSEKLPDTELSDLRRSQFNARGRAVHLDDDAIVLAPNAKASVDAGSWYVFFPSSASLPPTSQFVYTDGQVYLDAGSMIDVTGTTGVAAPLSENILTLQLRGAEFADAPLQRDGSLRATDENPNMLTVDLRNSGTFNGREWVGTPLADVTGFRDLIERGVGELTTNGGTVDLHAGGSVVLQRGSVVDVSGGWLRYDAGFVETSRVVAGSRLIDIADATPDQLYDGLYDPKFTRSHSKWGVTETYRHPLALSGRHYEDSYIAGRNGGSISITAPAMALDGQLAGNTTSGTRQVRNSSHGSDLPAAGKLALSFQAQDPVSHAGGTLLFTPISPTPPKVVFRDASNQAAADPFSVDVLGQPLALRPDRARKVVLSSGLVNRDGFGSLTIDNKDGEVVVPANVTLRTQPGGSIDISAANVDIRGDLVAPGGKLSFTVYDFSPYAAKILAADYPFVGALNFQAPLPDPQRGLFTLAGGASLSTAGLVVDDRPNAGAPFSDPVANDGGTVSIQSYSAHLDAGGVIDVSGGVTMDEKGKPSYGDAGGISILTGADPNLTSLLGGRLELASTLKGFSGAKGGSLALQAGLIRIGTEKHTSSEFLVTSEFFNQGGFSSFSLTGLAALAQRPERFGSGAKLSPRKIFDVVPPGRYLPGLVLQSGTTISPVVSSLVALPLVPGKDEVVLQPLLLEQALRPDVSLSFAAKGAKDFFSGQLALRGDLEAGLGTVVDAGPGGSVALSGDTLSLLGRVRAPGGSIKIKGAMSYPSLDLVPTNARPTVYLGPQSEFSTAGVTVLESNPFGFRQGRVYAGGTIDISGNLVAEGGSLLDVSGTSAVFDLPPASFAQPDGQDVSVFAPPTSGLTSPLYSRVTMPVRLDTDGGAITLTGGEELFVDSTLRGMAGGPTAVGGSLSISSGRFYAQGSALPTVLDATLVVTQDGSRIPTGPNAIGRKLVDADGQSIPARGYFAANRFLQGGFDSLTLGGTVKFSGPVTIDARQKLSVASSGVLMADDTVELSAPYVALGTAFLPPVAPDEVLPSAFTLSTGEPFYARSNHGPGRLVVRAELIDIGNLTLRGIGHASLFADGGDIRGDGSLNIAGSLYLRAGQIYPATGVAFTISASDYKVNGRKPGEKVLRPGSIIFAASGERQLPLSAGGELNVYASKILQGGVLRAPLGSINLGWDGSGEAPIDLITGRPVAETNRLVLRSGSETSVAAVDPRSGRELTIPYGLVVNGNSWIDPSGFDITAGGVPAKNIHLSARNLVTKPGSSIDISAGGNLLAYQWIAGLGGSKDILASTDSFAVIPGYEAGYAPYAAYNDSTAAQTAFNSDPAVSTPGYVNGGLSVGDRVSLGASDGLPAGVYTLLPARYALLPGAVLVTPLSGNPRGTLAQPDGSSIVSGVRFNALNATRETPLAYSRFEVAPASVVSARGQYDLFLANSFLKKSARSLDITVPRLPEDAGHLVFEAIEAMDLSGAVFAKTTPKGIGAFIDISSPADIVISGSGRDSAGPRKPDQPKPLVLDAARLSSFGAESLLIGGIREEGADGTAVDVRTGRITVRNGADGLTGSEIILVAKEGLALKQGARIEQAGEMRADAQRLLIDGDGVLLRVSSDPRAAIVRTGVTSSNLPRMSIGANAVISGESLILDSSSATDLSARAHLDGDYVSLDSGQISLRLNGPGPMQPTEGLVVAGRVLRDLQGVKSLSLLSYSSIDIYGTGRLAVDGELALHAAGIRGFDNEGGKVAFRANSILLDNRAHGTRLGAVEGLNGTLQFDARTIALGNGRMSIDQYANLNLNAGDRIQLAGVGRLSTPGDLTAITPVITAGAPATQKIVAGGILRVLAPEGGSEVQNAGVLGASLTLEGRSVVATSDVLLPSGLLTIHATGGDIDLSGRLDVGGTTQNLLDLVKYTDGGKITLAADEGDVKLARSATLSVAAQAGGGNAGSLSIATPKGSFDLAGKLFGQGGEGGRDGEFSLDVGGISSLTAVDNLLNKASFTEARSFRVRGGDVLIDGVAHAHRYRVSADAGSITVAGTIDASGERGGLINLQAAGSLVLLDGSKLTVAAKDFDAAGKGGSVLLEAGAETNGTFDPAALLDLRAGSLIDLGVAANDASSAGQGHFTGTLHLRAPQTATNLDLQINPLHGSIRDASSIVVEGYQLFDLTASGGLIDQNVMDAVAANAATFLGAAGDTTADYTAMRDRLLSGNAGLEAVLSIRPGAELINRTGDLTLGATNSNGTKDWNLDAFRFGPKSAPGVLTLRAAGDLVFYNALQDGFAIDNNLSAYTAALMAANPLLPINAQSWSYRLTAGADFSAADFHRVRPLETLALGKGSLRLGKDAGKGIATAPGVNATTASAINGGNTATGKFYQVIRTGSGDIDISAGRDVRLLNQFATIYTAGTLITDATALEGGFELPTPDASGGQSLGGVQQPSPYPVQYTLGGGNVSIAAQGDIIRLTRNTAGELVPDSERQLPMNWLYRRGYVDPATGEFGTSQFGEIASTTWWVDFSNFFEGVGALGGGNVSLFAGHDISNVDAAVPTNARMPKGRPDAFKLVEFGGGDVVVRAGHDIDGGVYYVERGQGTLDAGNSIHTNSTRSPSRTNLINEAPLSEFSWLPTTLFLGKGGFDVSARGDVLLGPTANLFLLPGGFNNSFWYKSYFSTYAADDAVNVRSLGGSITLRQAATTAAGESASPILFTWLNQVQRLVRSGQVSASFYQPWIRLSELDVTAFQTASTLQPATLRVTAFTGDINVVGNLTLMPSPRGTLDFVAGGSINGLQPNGSSSATDTPANAISWGSSRINISDASPAAVPRIDSPFAYQNVVGTVLNRARTSGTNFLSFVDVLFSETGSLNTVIQTKQTLHGNSLLHANDPDPVRLYARDGDISGLGLFSPKSARIVAGHDISDIAFYLQNVSEDDISIVSAGRDIVAYNANSPLRSAAQGVGNILSAGELPFAGDIQLGGAGTLEVLAGRNLDLGTGESNADGTATGIATIGNRRNPYLPFDGANIVIGAGIGPSTSLFDSRLDFQGFGDGFLATEQGAGYLAEAMGLLETSREGSEKALESLFDALPREQQAGILLNAFYIALREAGRDHNLPGSSGFGNYDAGFEAIAALFANSKWRGDVLAQGRDIRTKNGGGINIFAPGGGLKLAASVIGNPEVPPGVITETGGNINIFTRDDVNIGVGRIFTLRGGNEIIWSSTGDIAAGAARRTVTSAPPTRVIIDPQSADVETDLAGLSTGGGIGVLATVAGVAPGDVDLIAPVGVVDAGDAGIRASGSVNISATKVLNASNIAAPHTTGIPTTAPVAAPNTAGLTNASRTAGAANQAAEGMADRARQQAPPEETPSDITVEVIGYGGGEENAANPAVGRGA